MSNDPATETGRRFEPADRQRELNALAAVFRRKWNPVILYVLIRDGPTGFSELAEDIDDVSHKALSESLKGLEALGVVDRSIVSDRPFRVEYAVTERGRRLAPIFVSLLDGQLDVG